MTRRVYLEPPWVMHTQHQAMVDHPPDGYELVIAETRQERVFRTAVRSNFLRSLLRSSDAVLPTGLVKSWLERRNTPPVDTVLTYAAEHLVLRPEPWVLDVEFIFQVVGRHPKHLRRFRRVVERVLASPFCRRVLCQSEACRGSIDADLDTRGFADKLAVVHWTAPTPPRFSQKQFAGGKVRLLFIGASARENSLLAFEYKGGREVLETFVAVRRQFPGVELVMRTTLPPDLGARYRGIPGLRVIEDIIPWQELEREYLAADIFLLPSHTTIPTTLVEAMSFELPVVTIDSWANAEYVEDGKTGLVAPRSKRLPYHYAGTHQVNFGTGVYDRAMRRTDPETIAELTKRVLLLAADADLRRRLGGAARDVVERGRLSAGAGSRRMRAIFDEAVDGAAG